MTFSKLNPQHIAWNSQGQERLSRPRYDVISKSRILQIAIGLNKNMFSTLVLPLHRCVLSWYFKYFPEFCLKSKWQANYSVGIRTHDLLGGLVGKTLLWNRIKLKPKTNILYPRFYYAICFRRLFLHFYCCLCSILIGGQGSPIMGPVCYSYITELVFDNKTVAGSASTLCNPLYT